MHMKHGMTRVSIDAKQHNYHLQTKKCEMNLKIFSNHIFRTKFVFNFNFSATFDIRILLSME